MLRVKDLMVFYENMVALNNVSMRCGEGQIVGVFGANSAGKSTLCYAISGIILDIMKKEEMAGGERVSVHGIIEYKGRSPVSGVKMGLSFVLNAEGSFRRVVSWKTSGSVDTLPHPPRQKRRFNMYLRPFHPLSPLGRGKEAF
jgi:ABC-type branched-subunit amino acid transport system ATPase component